ncbi:DUF4832 domain-containing protein [Streptomyces sp. NPDC051080]|uniref:DUF4832 domain-containing protein n=1 Tax=Streptomyces sp. NPDC051080 TaxID=3157222 RepID=UPI00344A50D9
MAAPMRKISRRTALGLGLAVGTSAVALPGAEAASPHGPAGAGHARSAVTKAFTADRSTVLRNPLNGWVLYGDTSFPDDFWTSRDAIRVPGVEGTVRASDYASTFYLRIAWSRLEPAEGVYGWDTDKDLKAAIATAQERGLRLAFRVVVDSRDKSYGFTPDFVRDAGAAGYETRTGSRTVWSPYPDDPVFQAKYAAFVRAFAQRFDDPGTVDFIDGYGLGKWGEGHSMRYVDYANRESVLRWVVDLYADAFTRVPLAINYHRLIGAEKDWGAPDADSERLLDIAVDRGFMLRHDAFGMTTYYGDWERAYAEKWRYRRPILMEGGWVTTQHNYTVDPRGYETVADVRNGEFDDSAEAHVSALDFRNGETLSWFTGSFDLVKKVVAEAGYRLYPTTVKAPAHVVAGATAEVRHDWANLGWANLPNDLPQWKNKYRPAVALLRADGTAAHIYVDSGSDPSAWRKGAVVSHIFRARLAGVAKGGYRWGVAIVDTTRGNAPGIELAAKEATVGGWLVVGDVTVH